VTSVVFGYFKLDKRNNIIDIVDVDNPPVILHTKGMWLDVPNKALELLSAKKYNIAASIHSAQHVVLSLFPNVVITSGSDVRTECKAPQKEYAKVSPPYCRVLMLIERDPKKTTSKVMQLRGKQLIYRLTFYDAVGNGGAGLSRKAFDFIDLLLEQAVERVEQCLCASGCPECMILCFRTLINVGVASANCKEGNIVASKIGASIVLKCLRNCDINISDIADGNEKGMAIETIVPVHSRVREAENVVRC
jgi:DEAD/DEAH box helicase domain-containing protein